MWYVYYLYYLVNRSFLLIETAQAAGVIVKTDDDENDPAPRVSDLNFSHGWSIDDIVYLIMCSTTNQPHKLQT